MNNIAKRKCYEIVLIAFQVGLTYVLSKYCNLKGWSEGYKLAYIIALLVITVYTWFFDIRKIMNIKSIKNIISKIYNFLVVVYVLVWLFSSLERKKKEKISNDYNELLILISNVLKIVYINVVFILISSLLFGKDMYINKIIPKIVVLYIFIYLCVTIVSISKKELKECTRNIITIISTVIIVILQLVNFKEVFVVLILTIIIPIVNWYFSKERLYFLNKTQQISLEEEKKWAIYKTHSVIFSVAIGIVLIIKALLGEERIGKIIDKINGSLIIVTDIFVPEKQVVHPNMVMGWTVILVYFGLFLLLKRYRKKTERYNQ